VKLTVGLLCEPWIFACIIILERHRNFS